MKILFVITFLSFLVLALALLQVTRHVRRHAAESPEAAPLEALELTPLATHKKTPKQQRRSSRRKTLRAVA